MDTKDMGAKIVGIAEEFSNRHDISIYQLLKNYSYFENYSKISIDDLKNELKKKPELINSWLNYSENKRCKGGWFFVKKNENTYVLGNLEENFRDVFPDAVDACAIFVKHEIEFIRGL